jgi:hypothetical protein
MGKIPWIIMKATRNTIGVFIATLLGCILWGLLVMGAAGPPPVLRNPLTTNQVVIGTNLVLNGVTLNNPLVPNYFTTNQVVIGTGLTLNGVTLSNTFLPTWQSNGLNIFYSAGAVSVPTPTQGTNAATKAYVDGMVAYTNIYPSLHGGTRTLAATNVYYYVNADAAVITLPTAVGIESKTFTVWAKAPCNTFTLTNFNGTQTIQDMLAWTLISNAVMTVVSDGTNWRIKQ